MPMYKLGKAPARHAIALQFADVFDAKKLPTPPAAFGHYQSVADYHMLGNDAYGNCVWAGAAHETMVWSLSGGRDRARFTTKDVLSDYTAVTGFDPKQPDTDQGTDMKVAASYRRKTGIIDATGKRHTIDAYIALKVGSCEQLALAIWLMGAAGIGVQLPESAEKQFDQHQPWSIDPKSEMAGGHYVSGVGRAANGNFVIVTWGRTQEVTPDFYERFNDEAVAYLSMETLNDKNLSPEGFDAVALRQYLASL